MIESTNEQVIRLAAQAIARLPSNPYGLHVSPEGARCVDGRWWVALEFETEPKHRSDVWAILDEVEEMLGEGEVKILVTAA